MRTNDDRWAHYRERRKGLGSADPVTELPEDADKFFRIRRHRAYPKDDAKLALAEREFLLARRKAESLWNIAKCLVHSPEAELRFVEARLAYGRWVVEFQRVYLERHLPMGGAEGGDY
jgi:hypothetical protein